jgi:hypothetical protein
MRSPFVLPLVCLGFASLANAQDNAQLQADGRLLSSLLTRHRLQVCASSDPSPTIPCASGLTLVEEPSSSGLFARSG